MLDLFDSRERWERLVPITLERLRMFADVAGENGYVLAYSGGKDSDCVLTLAREAGVKFDAVHHLTTIDPPEIIRHVRKSGATIQKPKRSMIKLMEKKGLPSRLRRWCCQALKERTYPGRIVLTGVRWAESSRRSTRRMVEAANRCKSQKFLHAIIDWKEADVWGYLRDRGVETCSLYEEGFRRIGCVCCPLQQSSERDAVRWPRITANLRRAFMKYCELHPDRIDNPAGMWDHFVRGDLGRRHQVAGCPLFADERDEEE